MALLVLSFRTVPNLTGSCSTISGVTLSDQDRRTATTQQDLGHSLFNFPLEKRISSMQFASFKTG